MEAGVPLSQEYPNAGALTLTVEASTSDNVQIYPISLTKKPSASTPLPPLTWPLK